MYLCVLPLVVLMAPVASAATITYFGAGLTTHGAWRTPSVVKPDDPDGNNIYGSAGYSIITSPGGAVTSLPSDVASFNIVASWTYTSGNLTTPNYTSIDNPTGYTSI